MGNQLKRIQFLDFMRGFAVVVMVMGHSIDAVLSREMRTSQWFILYDFFRGFTAPIFLFVSGYAYIIATEKKWGEVRASGAPLVKRFGKIALLFVIGYALHFPFFSFAKIITQATAADYAQFFQVDVLHCVAATLLILQALLFVTPTPRAFAFSALAVGAGIVLLSPIVWSIDFAPIVSPALSPYFNQTQLSIFPLFPFAAFMLAGVVAGHFFLEARRTGAEPQFFRGVLVLAIVIVALGIDFDLLPSQFYPEHDYWKSSPNFFLVRFGIVLFVTSCFYYVRRLPRTVEQNLVTLGQASLLVYAVHMLIVYGSAANSGLMQRVGQTLAAHQAVAVGLTVLVAMLVVVYVWNHVRKNYRVAARVVQMGLAGSVLLTFFVRPW
jgi:uncharacterized membrane protein